MWFTMVKGHCYCFCLKFSPKFGIFGDKKNKNIYILAKGFLSRDFASFTAKKVPRGSIANTSSNFYKQHFHLRVFLHDIGVTFFEQLKN